MLQKAKFSKIKREKEIKEQFDNAVDEYDGRLIKRYDSDYHSRSDGIDSDDGEWDTDIDDGSTKSDDYDGTGLDTYLNICQELDILPSSKIADGLHSSNLKVCNGALGSKEIKGISAALLNNTHVRILDLHSNDIDLDGTRMIRCLLQENFYIRELNLADNRIGNEAAEEIGKIIKETRCLVNLNIGGNQLDDRRSFHIGNSIAMNTSITTLNLSHNQFMSDAGRDIGMAIEINKTIAELDLSWNNLRREGAIAVAHGLTWNTGIKCLNLKFNGFADDGAEAIGKALSKNSTLENLDLSYNRITDKGAKELSKGLAKNTCLKNLDLSYNPITKEGGVAILTAAKEAQELVKLLLEEVYLDSRSVSIIQEILQQRRQLTVTYKGVARDTNSTTPLKNTDAVKNKIFKVIQKHLKDNNLRMLDLFNKWDRDKSLTLTPDEFIIGCRTEKIPLTLEMIDILMKCLDKNRNGYIEYQEFVAVSKLA